MMLEYDKVAVYGDHPNHDELAYHNDQGSNKISGHHDPVPAADDEVPYHANSTQCNTSPATKQRSYSREDAQARIDGANQYIAFWNRDKAVAAKKRQRFEDLFVLFGTAVCEATGFYGLASIVISSEATGEQLKKLAIICAFCALGWFLNRFNYRKTDSRLPRWLSGLRKVFYVPSQAAFTWDIVAMGRSWHD